jgi:hypothetical protein
MRYETLEHFLEDFQQGKVYVHCKSKEESDEFQLLLAKRGWKWFNRLIPLDKGFWGKFTSGWDASYGKKKEVIWFSDPYYPKCADCDGVDYRSEKYFKKPMVEVDEVLQLFR